MAKFAESKCDHCGANLAKKKPKSVVEVKPHPGEPNIKEWSFAPCPSCGAGVPVDEAPEPEPEAPEPEPEPEPEAPPEEE